MVIISNNDVPSHSLQDEGIMQVLCASSCSGIAESKTVQNVEGEKTLLSNTNIFKVYICYLLDTVNTTVSFEV